MGARLQNLDNTYSIVTVYENPIATKKLPTKTLLKIIDSNVRKLGEVKYDNQRYLPHQKPKFD